MHWRTITALLAPPVVAAVIPTASYLLDPAISRVSWREWIQVGAWVAFALLFELVVMLPAARLLQGLKYFRLSLLGVGATIWLLASLAWFAAAFRLPIMQAIRPAILVGLAGVAVCGTFVVLWRRPAPSNVQTNGQSDA